MEVREIFRLKGEDHFRSLEFALSEELSGTGGMVLAPGGGWITQEKSVELLGLDVSYTLERHPRQSRVD